MLAPYSLHRLTYMSSGNTVEPPTDSGRRLTDVRYDEQSRRMSLLGVQLETVRCHPVCDISDAAQELGR